MNIHVHNSTILYNAHCVGARLITRLPRSNSIMSSSRFYGSVRNAQGISSTRGQSLGVSNDPAAMNPLINGIPVSI